LPVGVRAWIEDDVVITIYARYSPVAMLIIVDVLFTPRDLVSHMSDVAIDPFLISERKEARAKGQGHGTG